MARRRIKIVKTTKLRIRVRQLVAQIVQWGRRLWRVNDGVIQSTLRIRVLSKNGLPVSPDPARTPVSSNGVTVLAGEKKCKTCRGKLENGTELAACGNDPAHLIHKGCVPLAGGKCPECMGHIG